VRDSAALRSTHGGVRSTIRTRAIASPPLASAPSAKPSKTAGRTLPTTRAPSSPLRVANKTSTLESLTAQERIALIGELWDRLDSAVAAPLSPALIAELGRRESAADAAPTAGDAWAALCDALRARLG
jgi:putative addiction module component (TIGR02574 family)